MDIDPNTVKQVARGLKLSPQVYHLLRERVGIKPNSAETQNLFNRFLLAAGTAFLLVGIASFVANNWSELHRFAKFSILQFSLIVSVGLSLYKGLGSLTGKAFLFAASVFVGLSLAVYGQIYQTGADPYGLFLGWALLVTVWMFASQQASLYALVTVLLNLALIFYWNQIVAASDDNEFFSGLLGPLARLFIDSASGSLPLLVLALNLSLMAAYEFFQKKFPFLSGHLLTRLTGILALAPLTSKAVWMIFARESEGAMIYVAFFSTVASFIWYFRFRKKDLLLSSVTLLALIVFVTFALIKAMTNSIRLDAGLFVVLAIAVLAQTYAAGLWLKKSSEDERIQ
jgi:uncharacterized membrane protein